MSDLRKRNQEKRAVMGHETCCDVLFPFFLCWSFCFEGRETVREYMGKRAGNTAKYVWFIWKNLGQPGNSWWNTLFRPHYPEKITNLSRWWFQVFFIFTPICWRFPIRLICLKPPTRYSFHCLGRTSLRGKQLKCSVWWGLYYFRSLMSCKLYYFGTENTLEF